MPINLFAAFSFGSHFLFTFAVEKNICPSIQSRKKSNHMAEQFAHGVCKHIVNEISSLAGFNGIKNSSSDVLVDVLRSFIVQMGESSAKFCALSGRSEVNFYDVAQALEKEGGMNMKHLYQYFQSLQTTSVASTSHATGTTTTTTPTGDVIPVIDTSRELDLSLFDFHIPPFPKPMASYLTTTALNEREHHMQSLFHASLKMAASEAAAANASTASGGGTSATSTSSSSSSSAASTTATTTAPSSTTVVDASSSSSSTTSTTTTTTPTTGVEPSSSTSATTGATDGGGGGGGGASGVDGSSAAMNGGGATTSLTTTVTGTSVGGVGGAADGKGAVGGVGIGGDQTNYDQFEQFLSENIYLPPLPPRHTFTFTPVYNKKQENSLTLQQVRTRHKRMVQASLTKIHEADLSTRTTSEASTSDLNLGALGASGGSASTSGVNQQQEAMSAILYNIVTDLGDESSPAVLPPSDESAAAAARERVVNPYLVIVKQRNAQLLGAKSSSSQSSSATAANRDLPLKKAHETQVFNVDSEDWGSSESQYAQALKQKEMERVSQESQDSAKKKKKRKGQPSDDGDVPSFSLKKQFVATDEQDIAELLPPPSKKARTETPGGASSDTSKR